jgi:D-alanyl-D-alanine carboxypeptidase
VAAGDSLASGATMFDVDAESLQEWLDAWRAEYDVPGMVAGVRVGDAPAVVVASGHDGPDSDAPLDPSAPFFIASLTKTFVAATVMQLAEEGLVDLSAPAADYVELWPAASQITLRQLLSHTSGLPSLANLDASESWERRIFADLNHRWTAAEALGIIAGDDLVFEPGSSYHYSNANFIVAGLVVEAVTGEPLADVLRSRLIEPLGLDDTYLHPADGSLDPRIPHGVYSDPEHGIFFDIREQPLTAVISVLGAAGAMVSNPADVLDWFHALYGGTEVLSQDSVDQLYQPEFNFGLGTKGLCPCASNGAPYGRGHEGIFPGFDSIAAYYPSADVSVVLYSIENPFPGDLEDGLVEIMRLVNSTGDQPS